MPNDLQPTDYSAEVNALVGFVLSRTDLPGRARYNVACFFSRLYGLIREETTGRSDTASNLPGETASNLPGETASNLPGETASNLPNPDAFALSSLDHLRDAFAAMDAVERAQLVRWAQIDPSLEAVRKRFPQRYGEILRPFLHEQSIDLLSDVGILSSDEIRTLRIGGFWTIRHLLDEVKETESGRSLDVELIESGKRDRVADVVTMVHRLGLERPLAEMLISARIESPESLAKYSSAEALRTEIARHATSARGIPSEDHLQKLLDSARDIATAPKDSSTADRAAPRDSGAERPGSNSSI